MVKQLSLTLDNWIVDIIDKRATEEGKNRSELINELLTKQLTKFEEAGQTNRYAVKPVKPVKAK